MNPNILLFMMLSDSCPTNVEDGIHEFTVRLYDDITYRIFARHGKKITDHNGAYLYSEWDIDTFIIAATEDE